MTPETKRNFAIGAGFLLAIVALGLYSSTKSDECPREAQAIVALVDFTDPIGEDAKARLKDIVWNAIEGASDHANVVLRAIAGKDASRRQIRVAPRLLCRPEKPSFISPLTGPVRPLERKWVEFKNEVCGRPADPAEAEKLATAACSDPRRSGSFFEQSLEKSFTSPIAEQVIDGIRRHLPPEVEHWRLIVASDWREYNPPAFDIETVKCNAETDLKKLNEQLLIGQAEKLLVGTGNAAANNRVDSILILRSNMTQDEADCLEQLADGFFRLNMASPPPGLISTRLSVTVK